MDEKPGANWGHDPDYYQTENAPLPDFDPTQLSTQPVIDPRRLGEYDPGLEESEIVDIMCILTPASRAAIEIVENTARVSPQHVLLAREHAMGCLPNNQPLTQPMSQQLAEAETFVLERSETIAHDLALRFSSSLKQLHQQFCFGRNTTLCDIILPVGPGSAKRISNMHFKIYMTNDGIVMLEDTSTNGTMVDEKLLKAKAKDPRTPKSTMLSPGAMINLVFPEPDEIIKFIVRMPDRTGYDTKFGENLHRWLVRVEEEKERRNIARGGAVPATSKHSKAAVRRPLVGTVKTFGMHWNGGREYNVVDLLGKGAFATVYKLAKAMNGELLAAKELEKKRFMKNGHLDQKLDNEMKIMQDLKHPNIVQYIDTRDVDEHLYIIMEYVPYGNLAELLMRADTLPEQEVMRMACQIFSALAYLHSKRITHRDIKPDNILIASEEPFDVKLSDFGLSKVVGNNNDTFLKTFCGTLLYCAPEVFPHYSRNGNRKRRKPGEAKKSFHSYSQSVDIWSFGAVLWNALCGDPPFEGIMDNTGRAMFDRITGTPLDVTPLRDHGVSEYGIDLLVAMLNVDPARRPTERECLTHPWLSRMAREIIPDSVQPDLNAIPEEDEEDGKLEAEVEEGISQLSFSDRKPGYGLFYGDDDEQDDDVENDSESIDPRQSKRPRGDPLHPRYQRRYQSQFEPSPEEFQNTAAMARNVGALACHPRVAAQKPRRLFGELGLRPLDQKANQSLVFENESSSPEGFEKSPRANQSIKRRSKTPIESQISPRKDSRGNVSAASLYGAEALVSKLTMKSSPSPSPPNDHTSKPRTPDHSTPETPSAMNAAEKGTTDSASDELTPKAPNTKFSRQIDMEKTPAYYYEPCDKSTHNLEYASRRSGLEFGPGGGVKAPDSTSMPSTDLPSPSEDREEGVDDGANNDGEDLAGGAVRSPRTTASGFVIPAPRIGKLTTTDDSFDKLVLRLFRETETWGRRSDNTLVYSDPSDLRVPKLAFSLWFFLPGAPIGSKGWAKSPNTEVQITTNSSRGIRINGKRLDPPGSDRRYPFGILYTGDVIEVFDNGKGNTLKFVCEFTIGKSAKRRPEGSEFHIMMSAPCPGRPEPCR